MPTWRRIPSALERLAGVAGGRPKVVTLNQAILPDRPGASGARTAQILVEFQNIGPDAVEMNPAMSTYSTTAGDGATTERGAFSSVHPLRLAPGEKGYMLSDITTFEVNVDQLVGVSSVIACRDARPSGAGATRRRPWQLVAR